MSPSFFLTICLGGILCLTPLAVYFLWLSTLNRRSRPTVVSTPWEFVAMLCGLAGFLFCLGVLLALLIVDSRFFTGGPFITLGARMPWLRWLWAAGLLLYVATLAMAIRRGLARRADSLSVYNIDAAVLDAAVEDSLTMLGRTPVKVGATWNASDQSFVEISRFPIFEHSTVKFVTREAPLKAALENELRIVLPKLPAAVENLAAPWIAATGTCMIVAVGCCIALIFALPFLP